jgi:hypothetical protein
MWRHRHAGRPQDPRHRHRLRLLVRAYAVAPCDVPLHTAAGLRGALLWQLLRTLGWLQRARPACDRRARLLQHPSADAHKQEERSLHAVLEALAEVQSCEETLRAAEDELHEHTAHHAADLDRLNAAVGAFAPHSLPCQSPLLSACCARHMCCSAPNYRHQRCPTGRAPTHTAAHLLSLVRLHWVFLLGTAASHCAPSVNHERCEQPSPRLQGRWTGPSKLAQSVAVQTAQLLHRSPRKHAGAGRAAQARLQWRLLAWKMSCDCSCHTFFRFFSIALHCIVINETSCGQRTCCQDVHTAHTLPGHQRASRCSFDCLTVPSHPTPFKC